MGTISENFSWSEFQYSKVAKEHGICNVIIDVKVRDSILALVNNVLQPLRTAWGSPLEISSGYRSRELNSYIGGVPTSQHIKGEAADILTSHPFKLASMAKKLNLPYDQMILYPNFVHFSHKLNGSQRGQILYNKSYSGERFE